MAKNEDANGATPEVKTVALVEPKKVTVHGSIVLLSEWKKGSEDGKFKHDTRIVTISDLEDGSTKDVFITRNQWKEYGCEDVLYVGNAVTFTLEDCIKDVTGYKETSDSDVLKAHEGTYKSFNRVIVIDDIILLGVLERRGISFNSIQFLISKLGTARMQHDMQKQHSAVAGGSIF